MQIQKSAFFAIKSCTFGLYKEQSKLNFITVQWLAFALQEEVESNLACFCV